MHPIDPRQPAPPEAWKGAHRLARAVEKHACETMEELQDVVADEWDKLDKDALLKLADSMPARCKAVLDARGWHTKY